MLVLIGTRELELGLLLCHLTVQLGGLELLLDQLRVQPGDFPAHARELADVLIDLDAQGADLVTSTIEVYVAAVQSLT